MRGDPADNVFSAYPGVRTKGTKKKGKVPKGSHRMPDGSIMKNSDMKK